MADLTARAAQGAFKYAGVGHAKILRLDVEKARALPGVLAVITAEDVPPTRYGKHIGDRTLFATDVVRFHGEVLAAVAAETGRIAAEALDLIEVEYEPLPIVNDIEESLAGEVLLHPEWESYTAPPMFIRSGNVASEIRWDKGDLDSALAGAAHVVRGRYRCDGSHAVPIEPRAVVAQWEAERVTIWSSTQVPYGARDGVALTLGIPQSQVRVIVPTLGGGFGGKCDHHFEAHVAALARAAGQPVRLVFNRTEEFVATDKHREEIIIELESGVDEDGHVVGRRSRVLLDNGAYTSDSGFGPEVTALMVTGPYRLPALEVEAKLLYTNRTPSGSVRGPSGPNNLWALEQHMDEIAAKVGLDPVEIRRRNLVEAGDEGPTGQTFDPTAALETLDRAAEMIGWGEAELADDEAIGFGSGYWGTHSMPSAATLKLNSDGSATIVTGAQEGGSGAVMALPLLAAPILGMKPEDFGLLYQDTDAAGWDMGSCGSQTTINNGRAVVAAAEEVRDQLLDLAAERLEANRSDIELVDGEARVKGSPDSGVPIAELAARSHEGELLVGRGSGALLPHPEYRDSGCSGGLGLRLNAAPSFFTQAARVKVDRDTGVCRVIAISACHQVGRVLNPGGALGQFHGGIVMGVGFALTEGVQLRDDGLQGNSHLLDYKLVTAADAPEILVDLIAIDDPGAGKLGAKGLGEQPCLPTAGAIANAIAQVIGGPVTELPMTPERVWSVANAGLVEAAG